MVYKSPYPYLYGRLVSSSTETLDHEGHPGKWKADSRSSRMGKVPWWRPGLDWLTWLSLVLSFLAVCAEWQFMSFTVYLNAVKEQFSLTQLQVDLMLGLNCVGYVMTFPACLGVRRFGIHRACALGTTLAGGSYSLLWAATHSREFYKQHPELLMLYFLGVGIGCAFNFAAIMEAVCRMCPAREVERVTSGLMAATNVGPFLFTCLYAVVFYGERHPSLQRMGDYMLTSAILHVATHTLALLTFTETGNHTQAEKPIQLADLDFKKINSATEALKSAGYGATDNINTKHKEYKNSDAVVKSAHGDTKTSTMFPFDAVERSERDDNDNHTRDHYDAESLVTAGQGRTMAQEYSMMDMIYALNRLRLITTEQASPGKPSATSTDLSLPRSPVPLPTEDVWEGEPPYVPVGQLVKPLKEAVRSPRFHLVLWASALLMGVRAMCVGNLNAYLVSFYLISYRANLPYVSPMTAIVVKVVFTMVNGELGSRTPKVGLLASGATLALVGFLLACFPLPNAYAISFVVVLWTLAGCLAMLCAPGILKEAFDLSSFHVGTGLVISASAFVSFVCQVSLGVLYDAYVVSDDRTCYGLYCYIWCFGIGAGCSVVAIVCVVVYYVKN